MSYIESFATAYLHKKKSKDVQEQDNVQQLDRFDKNENRAGNQEITNEILGITINDTLTTL